MCVTIARARSCTAASLLVLGWGLLRTTPVDAQENQVLDVADRRQLFVDHRLIDKMNGLRLELQEPQPANTILKIDKHWEGYQQQYVSYFRWYDARRTIARTTSKDLMQLEMKSLAC